MTGSETSMSTPLIDGEFALAAVLESARNGVAHDVVGVMRVSNGDVDGGGQNQLTGGFGAILIDGVVHWLRAGSVAASEVRAGTGVICERNQRVELLLG